jgi:hypothetical protein
LGRDANANSVGTPQAACRIACARLVVQIFSENRFPLFRITHGLAAHDLFGKPVPTFPDHARAPARFSEFFTVAIV